MKPAIKLALILSAISLSTSAIANPSLGQNNFDSKDSFQQSRDSQFDGQRRPHERMHPPKFMQDINMRNVAYKVLKDCKSKDSANSNAEKHELRAPADKSEKLTKAQCEFFKEKKNHPKNPDLE